jgi:predicted HicB family RNase H-like nuclease
MNGYLEYKGYLGTVEYSSADDLLCGEIAGIRGTIMYHGDNLTNLKHDFETAVDHYLSCCQAEGKEPQMPCYGELNIKISPAVHKQLQIYAMNNGKTQNETVENALRLYMTA